MCRLLPIVMEYFTVDGPGWDGHETSPGFEIGGYVHCVDAALKEGLIDSFDHVITFTLPP